MALHLLLELGKWIVDVDMGARFLALVHIPFGSQKLDDSCVVGP
jgi:hypothetical protein